MNTVVQHLLDAVADIKDTPAGAYNLRVNGKSIGMSTTPNINIVFKENGAGLEVYVKPGTKNETVHVPAIIDNDAAYHEVVYNDFHIGDNCENILIVAGCGIHNCGSGLSQHDGIHRFFIGKNAAARYVEKHYGEGEGTGERVLNPVTEVFIEEGGNLEIETVQIEGVDSTNRITKGKLGENATLIVKEKIMTSGSQSARTEFVVDLDGKGSSTNVISRSVAKDNSAQEFVAEINGNNDCMGHSECDAIIMDNGLVKAIPIITATHPDASLIHEAAIGKIAGEQLTKLMTLGLTRGEAETKIIEGFLK